MTNSTQSLTPKIGGNPMVSLLAEIRDGIREGNRHAAATAKNTGKTAVNTTQLRRDVAGIRIGDTGRGKSRGKDPLNHTQRRQIEAVKATYYEKREENPDYSLFSVCKRLIAAQSKGDAVAGYSEPRPLYSRVRTEIEREDMGKPIF